MQKKCFDQYRKQNVLICDADKMFSVCDANEKRQISIAFVFP